MRPLFVSMVALGVMVAVAATLGACGGDSDVDVVLTEVGDRPAAVVAEVRRANGIGRQEAEIQLSGVPSVIVKDVPRDEGRRLERRLERAGASVELE